MERTKKTGEKGHWNSEKCTEKKSKNELKQSFELAGVLCVLIKYV